MYLERSMKWNIDYSWVGGGVEIEELFERKRNSDRIRNCFGKVERNIDLELLVLIVKDAWSSDEIT